MNPTADPETVPESIQTLAATWAVDLQAKLPGASCSEVWAGRDAGGSEVVLKAPEANSEEREAIAVLREFAACGGAPVLRHDAATGAILMPRLRPGYNLGDPSISDAEAIEICARLTRQLRTAVPVPAIEPDVWFRRFLNDGPEDDAVHICRHMIASTTRRTLLHGDLHHGNILRDGDRWVVIDPKGIWGDPAFEPCSFIRNPIEFVLADPDPGDTAKRRIEAFAEILEEPSERVWGWAYAQTCECAWGASGRYASAWTRITEALHQIGAPYRRRLGA